MIKISIKTLCKLINPPNYAASYYKTVSFFEQLKQISTKKQKQLIIQHFLNHQIQDEKADFQTLMQLIETKGNLGITMKTINKHYIENCVPKEERLNYQEILSQGGLSKILCKEQIKASEITLHDINIFFKHISSLQGIGSASTKIKTIIDLISNISVLQGLYLLKIIDKKLTIGISAKQLNKILR